MTYAINKGAKGTPNGLSVNQAKSESPNDSPDAPDESNIIFECSNLEIHESVSDNNSTTDSSPGTTFKTAKEHNKDLLLVNTPKISNKSKVETPAVGASAKKGPTPPLDHNDPVTDGL